MSEHVGNTGATERPHHQTPDAPVEHDPGPAPRAQWVGFFLAPAAFFAHLQLRYVLVPWACVRDGEASIHLVGALSVVLAALGAFVAWRTWQRAGAEDPGEAGGAMPRTRLLGVVGLGMSLLFTLLLLAQWATAFFLSPCQ
jgi:hypothetical protein